MNYNDSEVLRSAGKRMMEKLREEVRKRISTEDLNCSWHLEVLDCLATVFETKPALFHRLWMEPLLTAGLSPEAAIAHIVESYFQPN